MTILPLLFHSLIYLWFLTVWLQLKDIVLFFLFLLILVLWLVLIICLRWGLVKILKLVLYRISILLIIYLKDIPFTSISLIFRSWRVIVWKEYQNPPLLVSKMQIKWSVLTTCWTISRDQVDHNSKEKHTLSSVITFGSWMTAKCLLFSKVSTTTNSKTKSQVKYQEWTWWSYQGGIRITTQLKIIVQWMARINMFVLMWAVRLFYRIRDDGKIRLLLTNILCL